MVKNGQQTSTMTYIDGGEGKGSSGVWRTLQCTAVEPETAKLEPLEVLVEPRSAAVEQVAAPVEPI